MSSSTTPEKTALRFEHISKTYMLYGSQRDQLMWILGLTRLGMRFHAEPKAFNALKDVSFEVPKGHRVGIVGRNGAGKTTLLKLICGNFAPSSGRLEVNGTVQALMTSGLGFHPEYTGRENVVSSLQYNGIPYEEYDEVVKEILDFCELGEFIDQPFKSYSLGMQARLMFAAASAIRPDILIVDEVLGAGDAYFVAKCKKRVEKLISCGCTMLLVSHSMPQVLELCKESIWLDKGQIRMRGDSFSVVKEYESFLHGPVARIFMGGSQPLESGKEPQAPSEPEPAVAPVNEASALQEEASSCSGVERSAVRDGVLFQEPFFVPHGRDPELPLVPPPSELKCIASGGVSRWDSTPGLKIRGFSIVSEKGETDKLISMRPAKMLLSIVAESEGFFDCRYAITIYDHMGRTIVNILSPKDSFPCAKGELHSVSVAFNPLQLGPDEYIASVSLHMYEDLSILNSTPRYDLLSRSFKFKVELPDSFQVASALFFHSTEWKFRGS